MPDFSLSEPEAEAIASFLESADALLPPFDAVPLTAFAASRTATLFASRLSCLGCHAMDGRGGRIGPDLSSAGTRLRPAWIRVMLEDPAHVVPGTMMPAMHGTTTARDRVAAWLSSRANEPLARPAPARTAGELDDRSGYLSLLDTPVPGSSASGVTRTGTGVDPAASLYAVWCAACHGPGGRGDGYNAAFLDVRPADHTDAEAMGARPDDTLYDAIAAGAFFLDGSAAMPGFATSLQPVEIRSLVRYIRDLCDCRQPTWAG